MDVTAFSEKPGTRADTPLGSDSLDRSFLRALYIDVLGRSPLPEEAKSAAGRCRRELISELAASVSFFESFYEEELFYFLLIDNFRPSTEGFETLTRRLNQRELSVKEAIRQIVSSQFFNARNPGNDTFVTVILEQLLGITVQKNATLLEAGKRIYDGKAGTFLGQKGSNQADLVRIVVDDSGFLPFFLDRRFRAIFGSSMPKAVLAAYADKLAKEPLTYPDILGEWVNSQAYEELLRTPRPKSDRVFIRSLFVDLLGRVPDYQEYRRCRNALLALSDTGPLRSVLIKLMLDANEDSLPVLDGAEPSATVRELFLRFLCREPSLDEEKEFTRIARASGCTSRMLARSLLTHAEYQNY